MSIGGARACEWNHRLCSEKSAQIGKTHQMKQDLSAGQVEGGADAGDLREDGAQEPIQLAAAVMPEPPIVLAQAGGAGGAGGQGAPGGFLPGQVGGGGAGGTGQPPFIPTVPPGAVSATAGNVTA